MARAAAVTATPNGIILIANLIQYAVDNEFKSVKQLSRTIQALRQDGYRAENPISRLNQVAKALRGNPDSDIWGFSLDAIINLSPALWIPGSELPDPVTGQTLPKLVLTPGELQGLLEGKATVKFAHEDPLPYTSAFERLRASRQHGYGDMLNYCGMQLDLDTELRVRKRLAFGGWGENSALMIADNIALSSYLSPPSAEGNGKAQAAGLARINDLIMRSLPSN